MQATRLGCSVEELLVDPLDFLGLELIGAGSLDGENNRAARHSLIEKTSPIRQPARGDSPKET